MLSELPQPVIFAHRGARAHAPENTLAAFEAALTEGADALELDVRLTADDAVVVMHDRSVDRTTDGTGRVARLKVRDIRALDAGSSFSEEFRGEKVPLLEEVFEAVGKRTFINIEFKDHGGRGGRLVERVCGLATQCGLQDRLMFSSFAAGDLRRARELLPRVPRGLLAYPQLAGAWSRSFGFTFGDYAALHAAVRDVDSHAIQRVHRLKRRIHVWTVNEPADMQRMRSWGADGLITDDPALAKKTLGGTR